eukprot:124869_1
MSNTQSVPKRSAETANLQPIKSNIKKSKPCTNNEIDTNRLKQKPPPNYICHKCLKSGHWINDCIQNDNTNNTNNTNKIPVNYICHKCSQKGHWIKDCPLNNTSNSNNINNKPISETDVPPLNYICHRCDLSGHWIKNCPTNNTQNLIHKPEWHPLYMNITLKGYLIKISQHGGIIKRDNNYKCDRNENDSVIFYFNHCNKVFKDQCPTKQLPLIVKFKIGFPKQRNNKLILAFDVEFDTLLNNNEQKEKEKIYG